MFLASVSVPEIKNNAIVRTDHCFVIDTPDMNEALEILKESLPKKERTIRKLLERKLVQANEYFTFSLASAPEKFAVVDMSKFLGRESVFLGSF